MIHVVGCNHGIQVGVGGFAAFDPPEMIEQRERFRALLEGICEGQSIQIVLEEDGGPEEFSGKQIAIRRNVPWFDINTSDDDKDRMGIPGGYVTGAYTTEQKNNWNHEREVFMVGKISEHRSGRESLLIICGFTHMQPLADILEQDGTVRVWDYRTLGWYRRVFAGDE